VNTPSTVIGFECSTPSEPNYGIATNLVYFTTLRPNVEIDSVARLLRIPEASG
jgi:hypothetical protein